MFDRVLNYVKNFPLTFGSDALSITNLGLFLLDSFYISFSTRQLLSRCHIFGFVCKFQINFMKLICISNFDLKKAHDVNLVSQEERGYYFPSRITLQN